MEGSFLPLQLSSSKQKPTREGASLRPYPIHSRARSDLEWGFSSASRHCSLINLCCVFHRLWLLKFSRPADFSGAPFRSRDTPEYRGPGRRVPAAPSAREYCSLTILRVEKRQY